MSLKGGIPYSKILDTIEDFQKGKKGASERLAELAEKGHIPNETYVELIERQKEINKKKRSKTYIILGIVLFIILCIILVSLAWVTVDYHNNAVQEAYYEGHRTGYKKGYDEGYSFYEDVENEYNFYRKNAVIVTSSGSKYHRYDCHHFSGKRFYIYNTENAKAKGYTACLDCFD